MPTVIGMRGLPFAALFYILVLFALGLVAAGSSGLILLEDPSGFVIVLSLGIVIALLDTFKVVVQRGRVELTISTAVKISSILLFSPPIVILSSFLGTALAEIREPRAIYKKLFNIGLMTVNYTILSVVYARVHGSSTGLFDTPWDLVALGLLALADLTFNSLALSLVISLASKSSVIYIWSENFKPVIWHNLSLVPLGAFMALLWRVSPYAILFAAIPLLLVRHSEKDVVDLRNQTLDALIALAQVLDERDEHTHHHCERVATNAGEIARAMGLSQTEIDIITRAGYLHDIGKVGMTNDILLKPGSLTPMEREMAKRHAIVGGELLARFPLFERGALYVRHHHERWDGLGYPDALKGVEIPLGARILSVADSFQAMVEDRPYRKGLAFETALEQLYLNIGSQFDGEAVQAFYRAKNVPFPVPHPGEESLTAESQSA